MKKIILFMLISITLPSQYILSQNKGIGINTIKTPLQLIEIRVGEGDSLNTVITDKGTLGIGTLYPEANNKLELLGNANISQKIITNDTFKINKLIISPKIGIGTNTPEAKLHIKKGLNESILRYSDKNTRTGYLLTTDPFGNAYWEALLPMSSIVQGKLAEGVAINIKETDMSITEDSLSLIPGKWLIIANVTTEGNLQGFNMYIKLMTKDNSGNKIQLISTGKTSGISDGVYYATPALKYMVEIPIPFGGNLKSEQKYWVEVSSSSVVGVTTNNLSKMNFYALRIDR